MEQLGQAFQILDQPDHRQQKPYYKAAKI